MTAIQVTIEGITPLLCKRFTDEQQLEATTGVRLAVSNDNASPREQAAQRLYLGLDGKPIIPQPNLFRCLIDAGKFFKKGKRQVTTAKSSLIPACVEVPGVAFPIEHKEPWTVDTRPIRNPSTGGRRLCHRPCFHDWRIQFPVTLDDSVIPLLLLRSIVDAAGKQIGLGDFRPDCKGPFGKFVVTLWQLRVAA